MFFKNKKSGKPKTSKKRTKGGKVPQGRTLSTYDHYLGNGKNAGSKKERPVVVIETNDYNDLAVVPLSSREAWLLETPVSSVPLSFLCGSSAAPQAARVKSNTSAIIHTAFFFIGFPPR